MLEKAVRKYFVRGRERWDTNIGCMTHHARARTHTHTQIQRVNCTPTMVSELLECVWDGGPTRSPPVPSIQQIRCNALPLRCMVVLK